MSASTELDRGTILSLLQEHGLGADPRYSQNYLCQPQLAAELVEAAGIHPGDTVLEVGPGLGSLSRPLLHRIGEQGLLYACEIDERFQPVLSALAARQPALQLMWGDALDLQPEQLPVLERIISNLPYNSTTPLVAHLLTHWPQVLSASFMIQADVWPRISAASGSERYGPLAVLVSSFATAKHARSVPPGAFEPPPHIGSAFIVLDPLAAPSRWPQAKKLLSDGYGGDWYRFLLHLFRQRRKTILNNLTAPPAGREEGWPDKKEMEIKLQNAGISPAARAEQLNPDQLARLGLSFLPAS